MKYIKYLSLFFAMLLSLWACDEENMNPLGEWTYEAPVIISPASDSELLLNENTPSKRVELEWSAATSSTNYEVRYTVEVDTANAGTTSVPFITVVSDNGGAGTTASIGYMLLDETLSMMGYEANKMADLQFTVVADIVGTLAKDTATVAVQRFATEYIPEQLYISGTATENAGDLSQGIAMKKVLDTQNQYEVYTYLDSVGDYMFYSEKLLPAHIYGGEGDVLVKNGNALSVATSGVYKVNVDLDNNTYTLTKIDRLGVIGAPFADQWNSDEALTYQGDGVWEATIDFLTAGNFIIRANNGWDLLYKHETGSVNSLQLESFANANGVGVEDIASTELGALKVTIDLSADGYTYALESDIVGGTPVDAPDALFLLDQDMNVMGEFAKDGDVFTSVDYFALQASVTYQLNSAQDGSGQSYEINSRLGLSDNVDADKAVGAPMLSEGERALAVEVDQAYGISIDFSQGELSWHYYNLKVFHWDDTNNGWDDRSEIAMTYSHPYTFTVSADLMGAYDTKFNSPWEVEFGAKENSTDDATATSGTCTNKGKDDSEAVNNLKFITTDGSYSITLTINPDYVSGNYTVE